MPTRLGEEISDSDNISKKFATKLSEQIDLPILLVDEKRTTRAADSLLAIAGIDRKTRNNIDDAVAAKLILETALNKIKRA